MPLHTDNKFPLSRLKKLSAAVSLAVILPMGAHAAGLGKLTVLSALGQPLRAEIELTSVSKEEEGSLVARLASADAFRKANIDFNPVLSSLRFSVEQRQGRQLIRISSAQALNEPFVDLLLELSGGGTRLVREYTFLLDPPDMRKPQAAQSAPATPPAAAPAVAKPAAVAAAPAAKPAVATPAASAPVAPAASASPAPAPANNSDDEPVSSIVTRSAPSPLAEEIIRNGRSEQSGLTNAPVPAAVAAKTAPQAAASTEAKSEEAAPAAAGKRGKGAAARPEGKAGDKTYRVKEGDTLADIANRNRDNTVSLDQMLIALYRANPDAFIGDNINRLRAGRVLSLPDAATAGAVNKSEARTTVVAQAQDFNAYRNKLAGQVASGPARKASEARQSGGGKVTARVEEKSSTSEARDRLQLSKAGAGAKDRAAAEKAAAEDKIAADKAIAEANDRVKALEKNVSDLQRLLEIKNKTLAEMSEQQKAAAKPEAPAAAPAAVEAKPAATPEEKPAEAKPVEAAPAPEPAKPEAAPAAAVAPAAAKPKVAVVPGPVATASFFDRIQDNPFLLPGAGALVALLAAWGVVRVRNNKKKAAAAAASDPEQEDEPAESPKETPPAVEAAAVAAAATAAVEAAEEPAPEPVAVVEEPAAAAAAEEPEVEAVDPIEEADMYISFGREEQAEDILQLALKSDPNRQAIRSKLLEIYAKRQDVDAFNDVARELHAGTGGIGEEWEKAVALGIVLDPTNPLYGAVVEEEIAPEEAPAPVEPEPDQGLEFDLDDFKGAEIQPGTPPADIGSKIDFDLELDNGVKPEEEAAPEPAAPVLNDIDLDLPPPETPKPMDVLEDDESAFAAEMSTKLDLAAAYQEIGDKEGARELLDEVIRGGSDAQIERARDMLSKLS